MAKVSVRLQVSMPESELEVFLQLIRQWEGAREIIDMAIKVDAPEMQGETLEQMFARLDPPLPYIARVALDRSRD